jgi:hypothetical protein
MPVAPNVSGIPVPHTTTVPGAASAGEIHNPQVKTNRRTINRSACFMHRVIHTSPRKTNTILSSPPAGNMCARMHQFPSSLHNKKAAPGFPDAALIELRSGHIASRRSASSSRASSESPFRVSADSFIWM